MCIRDSAGAVRDLVRNFLTDRELLEAESLHMIDPSGYTSADADVREAILRERLVRKQQQRRRSKLIELHMEMEDQERALLEAESEEETLEAESTEGALSSLTQYVKNRALRQATELDEREMEIE